MDQMISVPIWFALIWPLVWIVLAVAEGWRARMWTRVAELQLEIKDDV